MKREEQAEELWDSHSELIGTQIDDLDYWAGRIVMTRSQFMEAIKKLD